MIVIETDFQQPFRYPTALTACLGYFDGLHIGHQALIQTAKRLGQPIAVVTFDRNPKKSRSDQLLTPLSVKKELLETWGVDVLIILQFNAYVEKLSPHAFLDHLFTFGITSLVFGEDFRFGHHALGDKDTIFKDARFTSHLVSTQTYASQKISSSTLLSLLSLGHVETVRQQLGRPYQVRGYVGHGFKKGTELGYPTANVVLEEPFYLPKNGVYMTRFWVDGTAFFSLASLGYHPTVANLSKPSLEVHVLDFQGNLYEKHVYVDFLGYLREEQKFASLADLVRQMDQDKATALARKKDVFST